VSDVSSAALKKLQYCNTFGDVSTDIDNT